MPTGSRIHAEATLHRKLVLFAVQLEGYLRHFPNCHKYTLTQQIRQAYLDVYNLATECQKRHYRRTALAQLDIRHEQLRMMICLAHELRLFDFSAGRTDSSSPGLHRYLTLSKLVDELGRMIGGWIAHDAQASTRRSSRGEDAAQSESQGRQPVGAEVA